MVLIALGRPVCALISSFRGRGKTAWKLQTSAGNKAMRTGRDDCYIFHRIKAVMLVFIGSSGALDFAETEQ